MASFRTRGDVWSYRFIDGDGRPVERKRCSDQGMREEVDRAVESEAATRSATGTDERIKDPLAHRRGRIGSEARTGSQLIA